MKIETRGKYPGVKIHLDPEECQILLDLKEAGQTDNFKALKGASKVITAPFSLAYKMGGKITDLLKEEPGLLKERTPEQVMAILAKESEKAALQLSTLKAGGKIDKLDKKALKEALLKHAK